jgi:hypothetical protein
MIQNTAWHTVIIDWINTWVKLKNLAKYGVGRNKIRISIYSYLKMQPASYNKIEYSTFYLLDWKPPKYLLKLPVGKALGKQLLSWRDDGHVRCRRFMKSKLWRPKIQRHIPLDTAAPNGEVSMGPKGPTRVHSQVCFQVICCIIISKIMEK